VRLQGSFGLQDESHTLLAITQETRKIGEMVFHEQLLCEKGFKVFNKRNNF